MAAADAALSTDWDHTCSIAAAIANVNRKKGSKAIEPQSLHPMKGTGGKFRLNRNNISALKALAGKVMSDGQN